METLRITASHEIIEKVRTFLHSIQGAELEIATETDSFQADRKHLKKQLEQLNQGSTIFYTIEEAEEILDKTLGKQEDQNHR